MTYNTINDEEATPLTIQGGYSKDATGVKKHASSSIVRTMMVGTAMAVGVFLLMAGPSKHWPPRKILFARDNVEGMVSNLQHAPYVTYANKTPNPVRVSVIYPNSCFDLTPNPGVFSNDYFIQLLEYETASQPGECLPITITADMRVIYGRITAFISCDIIDTSGSDSLNYFIRMRKDGTCYVTN